MKPIYIYIITAALVVSAGCQKELDKDPIGLITPDQINATPTVNTITTTVDGSYQMLSSTLNLIGNWAWPEGTVIRPDFVIQDMASDDMQKKWAPDGDQPWMDEVSGFRFTANNAAFNGIWSFDYEGIAVTNQAISYLTNNELISSLSMNESLRNRCLGEAYFLRAFYYFDLVNNFGDVALVLKPLENFNEAYKVAIRVPATQVREQISADLAAAKPLLPAAKYSSNTERWRVSKGAVTALQAKIALYNKNWQEVISLVNELEASGFYSLNAHYFDNFSVAEEFTEDEVIFAYDHQSGKLPARGNGLSALLDWGFVAPTAGFINEFESNDPRLLYTVNSATKTVNKLLGSTNGTYKGNDDAPGNKIYIRFADVLLWKAEAYLETSNYPAAIAIINQIRQRARTTPAIDGSAVPAGTLPARNATSTNKDEIKGWLMHERRVELGFEGQRFHDLKRWGIAKQVLTAAGKNFQDKNYLYPIPQGEIDKTAGVITQNPGY
ncbi:putative outer membrane starch-binding protein [Arcticibacter tournemirensis]|uniref:RagB/SusD family nutrient uptake outer membrane protein n=1 Tax=Arcticibacter tournemirensis TaxID=699437 RepID=A0A5M9GVK0_9SPHI|nr:RagB/SusD family nutrient uptake outer membrane protein [Arcticibacter tournemirensis]KAA8477949.1 RagB/SusD family nutrient uptake outer membrane protein [Arcticibacter tournemirensis]TQM48427.1 putative outer membrane starch-binding protein [Arcticibacter tournemirensis]